MPDFGSVGPVAALAVGTLTPLIATLGGHEPVALTAGCVLAAALIKLTFNPFGPAPTSYDTVLEAKAIDAVVMTSSTNRAVRLALGSIYIYASITFAVRMTGPASDGVRLLPRLLACEPGALLRLGLTWLGCLANHFFAGLWASTGYCGQ